MRRALFASLVIPGLGPGIHVRTSDMKDVVDGRATPGHDGRRQCVGLPQSMRPKAHARFSAHERKNRSRDQQRRETDVDEAREQGIAQPARQRGAGREPGEMNEDDHGAESD